MSKKYIRSKKTQRVFQVLEHHPEDRILVQLVHSPNEEDPSVHEPFWLEHDEWEEVEHHELAELTS